jgi:hypothetical protein
VLRKSENIREQRNEVSVRGMQIAFIWPTLDQWGTFLNEVMNIAVEVIAVKIVTVLKTLFAQ